MKRLVDRYSALLLDLDGVLYLLDEPVPGAIETIQRIQYEGIPFALVTNNSSSTPAQYVEKLAGMGLDTGSEVVVTSSQALGHLLRRGEVNRGASAFLIGEGGLVEVAIELGFRLVDGREGERADFVLVGWDRLFHFDKLKTAALAIRNGARYLATNTDATYPTPAGLWPGAGSIVAAVSTAAGKEPEVAGKPNTLIVELALARLGLEPSEVLMVGDRLDTDIRAGEEAGVDTMLVLTGVSGVDDIERSGTAPTLVRESVSALLDA